MNTRRTKSQSEVITGHIKNILWYYPEITIRELSDTLTMEYHLTYYHFRKVVPISIWMLDNMTTDCFEILKKAKLTDVRDLIVLSKTDLLKVKGFSISHFNIISSALKKLQLKLKD